MIKEHPENVIISDTALRTLALLSQGYKVDAPTIMSEININSVSMLNRILVILLKHELIMIFKFEDRQFYIATGFGRLVSEINSNA